MSQKRQKGGGDFPRRLDVSHSLLILLADKKNFKFFIAARGKNMDDIPGGFAAWAA